MDPLILFFLYLFYMTFPLKPLKTLKRRLLEVYPQATIGDPAQGQVEIPEVKRTINNWCDIVTRYTASVTTGELVITPSDHVVWKYENFENFQDLIPKQIDQSTCVTIRRNISELKQSLPNVDVAGILLAYYKTNSPPSAKITVEEDEIVYRQCFICEKVNSSGGTVITRMRQLAEVPDGRNGRKMIMLDL